jgi:hypothetical protein
MSNRAVALEWWDLLSNAGRIAFANKMDPERFPTQGIIPPFNDPTVTGREVEKMWNDAGQPSISMDITKLKSGNLMGRIVKVVDEHTGDVVEFSFVNMIGPNTFRLFNHPLTFEIGAGLPVEKRQSRICIMASRDEWGLFANEMKEQRKMHLLKQAIIEQVNRDRYPQPTKAQLEAAAAALGLTKA